MARRSSSQCSPALALAALMIITASLAVLAVPVDAASNSNQQKNSQQAGGLLGALRTSMTYAQNAGNAFDTIFPGASDAAASLLHNVMHTPARILSGSTAKGTRNEYNTPLGGRKSISDEETSRRVLQLIKQGSEWVSGTSQDDAANSDTGESTPTPAPAAGGAPAAEVDALSRIHIRAAEEAAAERRHELARRRVAYAQSAENEEQPKDNDESAGADEDIDMLHHSEDSELTDGIYASADDISAVKIRSEERLVRLLRWRRRQRDHHRPPAIHVDYLPKYAKRYSGHESVKAHRRQFAAQSSGSSGGEFERPVYDYCHDGIEAIPSFVNFTCTVGNVVANFTAEQVSQLPPNIRDNCTKGEPSARACVCPRDAFPGRTVFGDVVCFWRNVRCSVARDSPAPCPPQPIDEPRAIQRCSAVPRNTPNFTMSVNVTCRWEWEDPKDYAFYGIDLIATPGPGDSAAFLVLNTTNRTVNSVRNLTGSRFAAFGSYEQISNAVFLYPVEPVTSVMPLTEVHPMVANTRFFARAINFNHLSDRNHQTAWSLSAAEYRVGQITGSIPVAFTFDLGNISAAFVHANRMFFEAGVRGNINPAAVVASAFTVDFTDLPLPPLLSQQNDNTVLIVVIVVVCVVVIGAIAIAVGCVMWRRKKAEDEKKRLRPDKED